MPPPPAGPAAGSGSGISVTMTSDVKNVRAMEAACSRAHRTTFDGSMIPAFKRSSYLSVAALYPTEVSCWSKTCSKMVHMIMNEQSILHRPNSA